MQTIFGAGEPGHPSLINGPDLDKLGENSAWWDPPNNSATVWVDNTEIAAAGMDMGTAIGRVETHELGHWGLQISHNLVGGPGPLEVGLMSQGLDYVLQTGLATLTQAQIVRLRAKCQEKHKPGPGKGGGGTGGGGGPRDPVWPDDGPRVVMVCYGPKVDGGYPGGCVAMAIE